MEKEQHFVGKVALKAIIHKGDQVLLTKDEIGDVWEIPGGRLDINEDPREGLARELQEELGITPHIGAVVYMEQFMHKRAKQMHLLIAYHVPYAEDEEVIFTCDPREVSAYRWVTQQEMQNYKIFDNCRHALEAFFSAQHS